MSKYIIRIINKYDSPTTLFFLDPPYEKSKGLYEEYKFDYNELNDVLKRVKGYFILTLNDSKNIRNIFKDFIIKGITVGKKSNAGFGQNDRKEVIIMNYKF